MPKAKTVTKEQILRELKDIRKMLTAAKHLEREDPGMFDQIMELVKSGATELLKVLPSLLPELATLLV